MVEEFGSIFSQMVILFSIVGAGYAAKKLRIMDEAFDKRLSAVVLNLSLPALILASVLTADELPSMLVILETIGFSLGSFAVLIAVAFGVTAALRVPDGHKGVFRFMMAFGNTGFIGYPVLSAVFGPQAVIYAVVYNLPFNFLVFTVGTWFIASDNAYGVKVKMKATDFVTPCIVASLAAIVLVLFDVHGVAVVGPALDTLGSLTTPATLLIVGSSLANIPARELLGGPRVIAASLFRLVVTPVLVWGALHFFVGGELLAILVVLAAMPVATNGTMLCYQYHGDVKTMAQGTFVTTACSLVTIPLLATAMMML